MGVGGDTRAPITGVVVDTGMVIAPARPHCVISACLLVLADTGEANELDWVLSELTSLANQHHAGVPARRLTRLAT